MSVDFDPVRLAPRRRRIDPLALGVIAVVVALGAAVVKPWEAGPPSRPSGPPAAVAVSQPTATNPPANPPAPSAAGPAIRLVSARQPTWSEISPIVTPHDAWGIRVLMFGGLGVRGTPTTAGYAEAWTPATAAPGGSETVRADRDARPIVILGVTVPRADLAVDARIWRVHRGGRLEWVDATPILSGDINGSLLYLRPGVGGNPFGAWEAGRYRIEVLVQGGIRWLDLTLPDGTGAVPPLDDLATSPDGLVPAAATDPSGVPAGAFATSDGVGVPLAIDECRPLSEQAAWEDLALYGGAHVASVALPHATGLGVALPPDAWLITASIDRLTPDATAFEPPSPIEGPQRGSGSPFVVFAAPGGGAWRPGVYAMTVSWTGGGTPVTATWHVELRPGQG